MALWTRRQDEEDDFFGADESEDNAADADTDTDAPQQPRQRQGGPSNGATTAIPPTTTRTVQKGLAAHEAAAVQAHFQNLGYHETYEASQETTLQAGFVVGYTENFDTALQIGRALGRAAVALRLQPREQTTTIITATKLARGSRLLQKREHLVDAGHHRHDDDDDDDALSKAVARTRTVLSAITALAESPSYYIAAPGEGDDEEEKDKHGLSASRTQPLRALQLEVEELLSDHPATAG